MRFKTAHPTFLPILLAASLALAGCSLPGQGTPVATETPAPTAGPTLTPSPQIPLVILVVPADMDKDESNLYQTTIYDLAQANGMRFQVRNTLTVTDVQMEGAALKIVIAFPPDPGLAGLVAAAPQAQFLAVGIPGLTATSNLSSIGSTGQPVAQQAFLAGYTAAMLALDYRIGIITSKDDPQGMAAETAFFNGMHYYCGLCQPAFPPWYDYPVHVEIPSDATEGQYPAYATPLVNYLVEVAYVYPPLATPELLDSMAQSGFKLIGESLPFDDLKPNWVASLKPEVLPAIQRIFPDLVAGRGGQDIPSPLFLTDVNPDLLSEGKQRLVQEVLDGLQAGTIGTGVTP